RDQGEAHSRKRIARLMRQAGLVGACPVALG
ncbi:IS3 family transposase, partial [Methylobacterium frigidaeris]